MEKLAPVSVSDLSKKFKTKDDQINFCREQNLYFPRLPGFDTKFFLLWLQGRKKLIPLGMSNGFSFNYYTKEKKFTKEHLFSFFKEDPGLLQFIPDDISMTSLNRNFLFSVLAFARQELYYSLYSDYKKLISASPNEKWQKHGVMLGEEMIQKIDSFVASTSTKKTAPFRLTKNKVENNSLQPINNNQGEKKRDLLMEEDQ